VGRTTARRTVSTAIAILATATGMLLGTGAAHAATAAKPQFTVNADSRTLPTRLDGDGTAFRPVSITFSTDGAGYALNAAPLDAVKVTLDASSLAGIAQIQLPKGCAFTTDQVHASCAVGNLPGGAGSLTLGVRAAAGAAAVAGAQGQITVKVTAANAVEQTYPGQPADAISVNLADGPDLAIASLGTAISTPAGRTTVLPLRVTNLGNENAKGVVLIVRDDYNRLTIPGDARGCVYLSVSGGQRGVQCTFPTASVAPGQTVELSTPLTLAAPAGTHGSVLGYGVGLTGDTWIGQPTGKPGTGTALRLVTVPSTAPVTPAAKSGNVDIETGDAFHDTYLNTGVITQVSAVGGSFHGTVGRVSLATVGARNSGTSTIRTVTQFGGEKGTIGLYVDFPASIQVITVPKTCQVQTAGPGAGASSFGPAYECASPATLAPGRSVYFSFGIRPLKVISSDFAGVLASAVTDPNASYALQLAKLNLSAIKA